MDKQAIQDVISQVESLKAMQRMELDALQDLEAIVRQWASAGLRLFEQCDRVGENFRQLAAVQAGLVDDLNARLAEEADAADWWKEGSPDDQER